jgi:hypothetical protein
MVPTPSRRQAIQPDAPALLTLAFQVLSNTATVASGDTFDLVAACLVWMGPASSGAQWIEAPVSAGASRF